MRTNSFVILFSLCASLHCTAAGAYVDPIYADGFDPFACAVTDNPQPNAGIAAEPGSGGCAAGMALVATFCVDRYEAALIDDTPGNAGAAWSPYFNPGATAVHAISALDAVPQGYISQIQAGAACANSGKRLCTDTEWLRACRGPSMTIYPYGNTRQPGVCNDYRAIDPITSLIGFFDPTQISNPCVNQQPQTLDRAGARPGCASAEGVVDLMGNIHEWTADPNGTFRGGDYVDTTVNGNGCLYATTAHSTSHYDYSTGFRCCTDAPLLPMRPARAGEH
jgi:sulfatase modifying factor 1